MLTRLTSSGTTTVTPGSPKALQRLQNSIAAFLWPGSQQSQSQQPKSTQLDAIDCFTNDLVNRNTHKWKELRDNLIHKKNVEASINESADIKENQNTKSAANTSFTQNIGLISKGMMNDLQTIRSPQLGLDIRFLSQAQLDNLLLATVEVKNKLDFLYLIRQCTRWQQLPSNDVLISCLKYLSTINRLTQIESLADTCRQLKHPFAKIYADLAPFKAIAHWHSGNSDMALLTLQRGYGLSIATDEGRRMIRAAFRTIVEDTLMQKSEAVLVSLLEVARAIHKEYNDIFIIACVWKQCFVSEWFCDQKSASDLFEHYKDLQDLVSRRAEPLCTSFLGRNNVDAVHRLIEIFLQYNQRNPCAICLGLLFNYQYLRKDLRACAEVVKSCSELQMPLSKLQNGQFLTLFLDQSEPVQATKVVKPPKPFEYNF